MNAAGQAAKISRATLTAVFFGQIDAAKKNLTTLTAGQPLNS
jgi:hypothetical protein